MHPYWLLPIVVGVGGFLLSADEVFQGNTWTGMKILLGTFFASVLLVVIGWFVGNNDEE